MTLFYDHDHLPIHLYLWNTYMRVTTIQHGDKAKKPWCWHAMHTGMGNYCSVSPHHEYACCMHVSSRNYTIVLCLLTVTTVWSNFNIMGKLMRKDTTTVFCVNIPRWVCPRICVANLNWDTCHGTWLCKEVCLGNPEAACPRWISPGICRNKLLLGYLQQHLSNTLLARWLLSVSVQSSSELTLCELIRNFHRRNVKSDSFQVHYCEATISHFRVTRL